MVSLSGAGPPAAGARAAISACGSGAKDDAATNLSGDVATAAFDDVATRPTSDVAKEKVRWSRLSSMGWTWSRRKVSRSTMRKMKLLLAVVAAAQQNPLLEMSSFFVSFCF